MSPTLPRPHSNALLHFTSCSASNKSINSFRRSSIVSASRIVHRCTHHPSPISNLRQRPSPSPRSANHLFAIQPSIAEPATVNYNDEQHEQSEGNKTTTPVQLAIQILWPDRFLIALTIVVLIINVSLALSFPLAIGDIFDVVRQHLTTSGATTIPMPTVTLPSLFTLSGTTSFLQSMISTVPTEFYKVLFRLCILLFMSTVANAVVAYLAPIIGLRFAQRMRKRLMAETLAKDQAYFDSSGKGDITARLTLDVSVVQSALDDFLGQRGIRSMLEVLLTIAIIATKNPLLALVSFVVTPSLSIILRRIVGMSASLTYARQQAAARAQEFATERLSNVRTVQIFAAEDREANQYAKLAQEGYSLARKCAVFQGIVEGAGRFAVNVGTLTLLALGGALVFSGRISLGTLLAFNVYNLFLSVGLSALAGSVGDLGKAAGALERITEVVGAGKRDLAAQSLTLNNHNDNNNSDITRQNVLNQVENHLKSSNTEDLTHSNEQNSGAGIVFDNVWFRYQGRDDWALKGLSFSVAPGSTTAIVGPSGSGKSTTVALMLGLFTPQSGTVQVDGITLSRDTVSHIRSLIGTVLQQPSLMSGTVRDQIAMGSPSATQQEIEHAAFVAHASEFIASLPQDYSTEIGERGHQLSGGQKQRLSIARAIVRKPRVLLLDEPTAALDVGAEQAVDEAISDIKDCTKIIIAHRLSTVRRADTILVIVDGVVVEQGTHTELVNITDGQYRRMVLSSEFGSLNDDNSSNGSLHNIIAAMQV